MIRVLVVKTSSMGDVLHTLPALTDAMQAIPDIKFDWVVEEGFAQIPTWHPAVDRVLPVALRRWRKNWFSQSTRLERKTFTNQLREREYHLIIDAQGLLKSAVITCRARGKKHGQDWSSAREQLASLFYNVRHHIAKQQHAVERTRQLFALSLNYPVAEHQGDYAIANRFINHLPIDSGQYIVFLHSTTRDDKHWPELHWQQLIILVTTLGYKVKLPWGTTHEQQRAIRLAANSSSVEVLPKLTLAQVADVLAGAKAVVSVDTGLSHLTAALDRPNLTLYGPTDPGLIGGYGKNQYSLISTTKDMKSITADKAFSQLTQLL